MFYRCKFIGLSEISRVLENYRFSGLFSFFNSTLNGTLSAVYKFPFGISLNCLLLSVVNIVSIRRTENSEDAMALSESITSSAEIITHRVGTKSKGVAGVLAFFLGAMGAHRYYLGYKKQGVIQTLGFVSLVVGWCLYIPAMLQMEPGNAFALDRKTPCG